jgi:CBS domain-containing protein
MKNVSDIFSRKGLHNVTIGSQKPVLEALKLMSKNNIGSIIVMDDNKFVGLLTERDYARKVILFGKSSSEIKVGEIMSQDLPKISMYTTVDECMEIMTNQNLRYLPVFENENYMGVISIIDVVKQKMMEQDGKIEDLQFYLHSAG